MKSTHKFLADQIVKIPTTTRNQRRLGTLVITEHSKLQTYEPGHAPLHPSPCLCSFVAFGAFAAEIIIAVSFQEGRKVFRRYLFNSFRAKLSGTPNYGQFILSTVCISYSDTISSAKIEPLL